MSVKEYVCNELLNFVYQKIQILPPETIIQLCVDFYENTYIEKSKELLWQHCGNAYGQRYKKRLGDLKKRNNLEDIISVLTKVVPEVEFVSQDLSNLPPITYKSIDVSSLLTKIDTLSTEMQQLKKAMHTQSDVIGDIQSIISENTSSEHKEQKNEDQKKLKTNIKRSKVNKSTVQQKGTVNKVIEIDSSIETSENPTKDVETWSTVVKKNVKKKYKQHSSSIKGTCTDDGDVMACGSKPITAHIYATRFHLKVTETTLKDYIKRKLNVEAYVNLEKTTSRYKAFYIKCECKDPSIFINKNVWPDRVYANWCFPRKNNNSPRSDLTIQDSSETPQI